MRLPLLLLALTLATGCAPNATTVMYHPETKQTAVCKRDPMKNWTWEEGSVVQSCVDQYKRVGFIEANAYNAPGATISAPPIQTPQH